MEVESACKIFQEPHGDCAKYAVVVPSSMAGSSKNVFQRSAGKAAATQLTAKEAVAPKPTRLFMSGRPADNACQPLLMMSRPGPAIATGRHTQYQHTSNGVRLSCKCDCCLLRRQLLAADGLLGQASSVEIKRSRIGDGCSMPHRSSPSSAAADMVAASTG
jgi:hypothetical protein